jgi:hypothetical protein
MPAILQGTPAQHRKRLRAAMIGATAPPSGLLSHHSTTNTRQAPFPAGRHRTLGQDQPTPDSAFATSAGARTGRRSWSSLTASPASRDVSSSPRSNAGRAVTSDTRRACSGYERSVPGRADCWRSPTPRSSRTARGSDPARTPGHQSSSWTSPPALGPAGGRLNHRRPDRPTLPMPSGAGSSPPWTAPLTALISAWSPGTPKSDPPAMFRPHVA